MALSKEQVAATVALEKKAADAEVRLTLRLPKSLLIDDVRVNNKTLAGVGRLDGETIILSPAGEMRYEIAARAVSA